MNCSNVGAHFSYSCSLLLSQWATDLLGVQQISGESPCGSQEQSWHLATGQQGAGWSQGQSPRGWSLAPLTQQANPPRIRAFLIARTLQPTLTPLCSSFIFPLFFLLGQYQWVFFEQIKKLRPRQGKGLSQAQRELGSITPDPIPWANSSTACRLRSPWDQL